MITTLWAQEKLYPIPGDDHPLKALTISSDYVPEEFQKIISHLKGTPLSRLNLEKIISTLKKINHNLKSLPKSNTLFL